MTFDPTRSLIGQTLGSATDRLGHRQVEQNHRTREIELRQATVWKTLDYRNGWGNYAAAGGAGNDWAFGMYRRTADGTVELRGLITKFPFGTSNFIAGETIAYLPAGFAPTMAFDREMLTPVAANGAGGVDLARLEVFNQADGSGLLQLVTGGPGNPVGWINLNSMRFSTV